MDAAQPDKEAMLWDVLKRYDFYIGTTNFKSGLIVTFNVAVVGAILLKSDALIQQVSTGWRVVAFSLLVAIAGFSLWSLFCVLMSISPRVSSKNDESVIFFGSVAGFPSASSYLRRIEELSEQEILADLAQQVHEVAEITKKKFTWLSRAAKSDYLLVCPLLLVLAFVVISC